MKITFLGATQTVTGSKYLIAYRDKKILIDCGLFQGYKELRLRNWNKLPVEANQIDAVILTHAHIDHSGYVPLLVKNGYTGKIYATAGTIQLCEILLPDSGFLQEEEAALANKYGFSKHKPALPLYTKQDAQNALSSFEPVAFNKEVKLFDGFSFKFGHAGHIIGAAFVKVQDPHTSILFSGDLGRPHDPVMQAPATPYPADYLVIESTYGNHLHDKSDPEILLGTLINKTMHRGGTVVVPAFAVGRAQNILYHIYQLKKHNKIPNVPVFLDSPMAISATSILNQNQQELRLNAEQCKMLCDTAVYVNTPEESKNLDTNKMPKIIISASGMATGGRVLHHIKTYASDARNTLLFTGYQAGGTRGARIIAGEKQIKIHGEMVDVRAQVEMIHGLSAHSDYQETLDWIASFKHPPKKVFITHGEPTSAEALKEKIEQKLHLKCNLPKYMQTENFEH